MRRSGRYKRKTGTAGLINIEGSIWMAGETTHYAGASAPVGWLKMNGAAVSRSTYAALFAAIGTLYGAGDGVNTFNLPDARGEFLRALDDGRGVDAGRVNGSAQSDSLKSHDHEVRFNQAAGYSGVLGPLVVTRDSPGNGVIGTGVATGLSGGTETRPRNIAMLALIKY